MARMAILILFTAATLVAQSHTVKLPTAANTSDLTVKDSRDSVLLRVSGNGRVGIGVASSNEPLEVASTTATAIISDGGGSTRRGLLLVGPTSSSDYAQIESFFYPSTGKPLVINNSGQGKVGIWTTNPQQALHVNGTIYSSSGGFQFPDGSLQTTAVTSPAQWITSTSDIYYSTGKVAVGTSTFDGTLTVTGNDGILATGTFGGGTAWSLGPGTRLHWYPKKAAFRTGRIDGAQWDDSNIGTYSAAFSYNTKASGIGSSAFGYQTTASGDYSTSFGFQTTASGTNSIAIGENATASTSNAVAIGRSVTASGASGARAFGVQATASGSRSFVLGSYISTNGVTGNWFIGDSSTTTVTTPDPLTPSNMMWMRFNNGYRWYSSALLNTGVFLNTNGTSWSSISDSTKKTNFKQADGEYFLSSLSKLKLGSWNYTSQDPQQFRHYGPMAQEIFRYFGHDGIGTIGNDTTLATADMDGIIMICLQALEKRTQELKEAQETITRLNEEFQRQQAELAELKNAIRALTGASGQENQGVSISEKRNR
jgi:hypothetical protein